MTVSSFVAARAASGRVLHVGLAAVALSSAAAGPVASQLRTARPILEAGARPLGQPESGSWSARGVALQPTRSINRASSTAGPFTRGDTG